MPVTEQSRRIERGVDAGADADFEHAIAGLDAHPLDRLERPACSVGPNVKS